MILEFKKVFADLVAARKPVEDGIDVIEAQVFNQMRIDPTHGRACLKQIMATYRHDPQVILAFQGVMEIETLACDEAELSADEFKQRLHQFQMAKQQQVMMMRMAGQVKTMMQNPEQAAALQQKAEEYRKAKQSSKSPEQTMSDAMAKMEAARQMMQQNNINEQAVMQRAMQAMADPNLRAQALLQMQQRQQQQQQQQQQKPAGDDLD